MSPPLQSGLGFGMVARNRPQISRTQRTPGKTLACFAALREKTPTSFASNFGDERLTHPPRGHIRPRFERVSGPLRGLVGMADVARVRNFLAIGFAGRDEPDRVASDVHISNCLFNLRHVAAYAFIAGGSGLMMRVRFNSGCVRAVRGVRAVKI